MTKDDLLYALIEWKNGEERLRKLKEKIAGKGYKVTPTLSLSGGIGGGGFQSKVEDFCLAKIGLEASLTKIQTQRKILLEAVSNARLNDLEAGIIQCVMDGESLASHARAKGIYISRVYKLRDAAVKKILAEVPPEITRFEW